MRHGTYSITARDPLTGELGVAVHSHWFSVGSLCGWARPGVGAVATQSVVEPAYGPRGLDLMGAGRSAPETLAALLAGDELEGVRQVGMVDAKGGVAVHTGAECIAHAGHAVGAGFTCQANMMQGPTVPAAMAAAFTAAAGDFADRLMAALEAADAEGGDIRGRQSAAMLIVPSTGDAWAARVDLRVEDHRDPLAELSRLLVLQRAYAMADDADELMGEGRSEAAAPLYERAAELAPESDELLFWSGLGIAGRDLAAGAERVRRAAEINPNWLVLLDRLSPKFAPAGADVRRALGR